MPNDSDKKTSDVQRVKFSYLKSEGFRVIHVDGGIGSFTPGGYVHLALYSERLAIPRELFHKVNPDGSLGEELQEERVVRSGVVRELEVDAIFSLQTAVALRDWLDDKIQAAQAMTEAAEVMPGEAGEDGPSTHRKGEDS